MRIWSGARAELDRLLLVRGGVVRDVHQVGDRELQRDDTLGAAEVERMRAAVGAEPVARRSGRRSTAPAKEGLTPD